MKTILVLLLSVLFLPDVQRQPTSTSANVRPAHAADEVDGGNVGAEASPQEAIGKADVMRITSRRCDIDRDKGIAFYEGKVLVEYLPSATLSADKLFAFFKSNELVRVVAMGNVAITNDTRYGVCDRASFARFEREIEMYGEEHEGGAKALLEEPGSNEVRGSRIKFWLDGEQVEIIDAELTVDKGKEGVKGL